jgi:NCS1 family nucleobase:cation symporter-1
VFGIAVQLPFVDTALYTGPVAKMLNHVDISWIVGLVVVGPVYYYLVRKSQTGALATNAA